MSYIRRMGYLLVLVLSASLCVSWKWNPPPPPHFIGIAGADIPRAVGPYTSCMDNPVDMLAKATFSSGDIFDRTYSSGSDAVNFVLVGGTNRTALHDPRSCLLGSGAQIENDSTENLPGSDTPVHACHAVHQPGLPDDDILYLYVVGGHVVTEATQIRAEMLGSALLGQSTKPVYFLRFLLPLSTDPASAAANHARLQQFAAQMWGQLRPKLETQ